jgi:hypothetical protein
MTDRIEQWFNGELEDWELTDSEVFEIEARVHAAVANKMLARPDVHTFPEHKTLQ